MDESTAAPAPAEVTTSAETTPQEVTTQAPAEVTTAPTTTANLLGGLADANTIQPDTSKEPWFNQLDEEYRTNSNVTKYASMNEMAKGVINQSALIGKKGIIKPGDNATPEEMGDYYNQLGRPTESTMYKYEGEGEVDQEAMTKFQEYAHGAGFSQDQYQSAIEFQRQFEQQSMERFEQEKVEEASTTQMELLDEMGEVEYNALLQDAHSAATALGVYDILVEHGLAGNKKVLKVFANANKSLGSSGLIGEHGGAVLDFDGQKDAIRANPAYKDQMHPDYNDLQAKMESLYKKRYPNQQ